MSQTLKKYRQIKELLDKEKEKFKVALSGYMDVERFMQTLESVITQNSDLIQCDPRSVVDAGLEAAKLHLLPGSITGLAHLVKQKKQCSMIIGYKGYRKLIYRNPKYQKFTMRTVYMGDTFEYEFGTQEYIKHVPKEGAEHNWDTLSHAYAWVKSDKEVFFDVMAKPEIMQAREYSLSGYWEKYYPIMAMKSVANRLANHQLDLDPLAMNSFTSDDLIMNGVQLKIFEEKDRKEEIKDRSKKAIESVLK